MKNSFLIAITLLFLLIFTFSCSNDDNEAEPITPSIISETTETNVETSFTSITISANVSSNGGAEITTRGVCWSTNPNPTIDNDKTIENSNTFTTIINDLIPNTTYYFRIYATNSIEVYYGVELSFGTTSLDNTTWDFLLIHNENVSWHADVIFNDDGTSVYDELEYPGQYMVYGTWTMSGNELTWDMGADQNKINYQFTGTLSGNSMSGTYVFGDLARTWSATPK